MSTRGGGESFLGAGIGIYAHRLTDRNKNGGNDQERSDHPFRVQDRLPCLEALLPQGQVARPVGPGYNVGTLSHGGLCVCEAAEINK